MFAASDGISRDIEQIASISKETSMNSGQTTQAAAELSKLSVNLQRITGEFKLTS